MDKKHRAIRNVSVMKTLKPSNLKSNSSPTHPHREPEELPPNSVSHVQDTSVPEPVMNMGHTQG